ncbi:alcohol dehydrogenase catalytic domain-containing protein [Saccharopolyspora mangrovi]|uniref:alcohol dehydrogenase n=1 Tax=Saccharopolyspora mangrovi TaxID=3082379 RepID=A0ABU6AG71_9PSEU|nr:alcohol dehydrogenase catalytic domain-containing protein [Saccharopolyspora sp. S2-29]MEB3370521.1 alcohol dehydrogenase catalytic domain-containing protein [Saccharopolyspora sp. S2-29]
MTGRTMRAWPLERFGDSDVLAERVVDVPTPDRHGVLVQVAACGVCGQDVMRRAGKADRLLGAIMGHEIAGTVVCVGDDVTRFVAGDRVACMQRRACRSCPACLRGEEVLCETGVLYGETLDGGYAEYCVIDELSLARIPDNVGFAAAAIAACAVGTGYHALRLGKAQAGQRVLITGAGGGVGIHAAQLARGMGAEVVAVTSTPAKVDLLKGYADEVLVLEEGRFAQQVREQRLQPDVVLDLSARYTLPESLRAVRRGGTVVIVGNLDSGPVEVLPGAFIIREIHLVGSKACSLLELEDCLRFIERGVVAPVIHDIMPLRQAAAAHERFAARTAPGRIVLRP